MPKLITDRLTRGQIKGFLLVSQINNTTDSRAVNAGQFFISILRI
jgi:CHASE1-domain containing sensor protein